MPSPAPSPQTRATGRWSSCQLPPLPKSPSTHKHSGAPPSLTRAGLVPSGPRATAAPRHCPSAPSCSAVRREVPRGSLLLSKTRLSCPRLTFMLRWLQCMRRGGGHLQPAPRQPWAAVSADTTQSCSCLSRALWPRGCPSAALRALCRIGTADAGPDTLALQSSS